MSPDEARNYGGFNYRLYLKSQKNCGILKASKVEVLKEDSASYIFTLTNYIQTNIIKNAREILPSSTENLFIGILIGEKDGLQEEIEKQFKQSSLSHVLAVSGMHVSYIILGITYLIIKLKIHRKVGYILISAILIIFMFITNFTPSVIRACIMAILLIISKISLSVI